MKYCEEFGFGDLCRTSQCEEVAQVHCQPGQASLGNQVSSENILKDSCKKNILKKCIKMKSCMTPKCIQISL